MSKKSNFQEFKNSNKIWAVGSVHSCIESFQSIKKYIFSKFSKGDKLIFLGNIIGFRNKSKEMISDILSLRFDLMAKFNLNHDDIIFLRGAQEEMFSKLLQLQTAPNPNDIIKY